MHANAATALEEYARPGAKVLDVGCGSGYLTAVPRPPPPAKRNRPNETNRFYQEWYNQEGKSWGLNISRNFLQ